jgi:RNA polymerase sigma-70 factor, ECF subfamily
MVATMTEATFDDSLVAAKGGDEVAFAHLWRTLNPRLTRYLSAMAASSASDLASETWLQVIRKLSTFSGDEAAFRGWVFTIARNKVIDLQRHDGRRPRTTSDVDLAAFAASNDTASLAMENLTTDAALKLIGTLPKDQAEVILLRVVAGLDAATVAAMTGKSQGAVRVSAHRGLRRLQALVGRPPVTL